MAVSGIKYIWFKWMLGVAGFWAISQGAVQASLTTTEIWPMDYPFLDKFRTEEFKRNEEHKKMRVECDAARPAAILPIAQNLVHWVGTVVYPRQSARVPGARVWCFGRPPIE